MDLDRFVADCRDAAAATGSTGVLEVVAKAVTAPSDVLRSLGDRALKHSPSHTGSAAHALHLLGDIATHPDRFDAENGQAYYEKALALAAPRSMRPLVAHCYFGLGKLYRRTEQREQAQEHLTTATTMYREMDMTYWLEKAKAEMATLD